MLIHLRIVCGCFYTNRTEEVQQRPYGLQTKGIYYLVLYRKSLSTLYIAIEGKNYNCIQHLDSERSQTQKSTHYMIPV